MQWEHFYLVLILVDVGTGLLLHAGAEPYASAEAITHVPVPET